MTVAEVIEMLKSLPEDALVLMSSDGEGNSYSPFSGDYSKGWYAADSTYSGDFYNEDEKELPRKVVPAIVLWPTN